MTYSSLVALYIHVLNLLIYMCRFIYTIICKSIKMGKCHFPIGSSVHGQHHRALA